MKDTEAATHVIQHDKLGNLEKMVIHSPGLDPIHLYIEDLSPGVGKLIITCFSSCWGYTWGGMGDKNMREFFLSRDNYYLGGKLLQGETDEVDYSTISDEIGECVERESLVLYAEKLADHYGPYRRMNLPTGPTAEWRHLFKILGVIREALKL